MVNPFCYGNMKGLDDLLYLDKDVVIFINQVPTNYYGTIFQVLQKENITSQSTP